MKRKKKLIKSGGLIKCPGKFVLQKWCSAKMDELNAKQGKKDDNEPLINVIRKNATTTGKRKKRSITFRLTSEKAAKEDLKCIHDHKDSIGGYKQETEKRYVSEGNDLHGTHCDECMMMFSFKEQKDMITPSLKDPMLVYLGRHKYRGQALVMFKMSYKEFR